MAMEKFQMIKDMLKAFCSQKKSYANNRMSDLEYEVGDWVYLNISPMRGVMTFGKKGKLSPRYMGPYEILNKVGKVVYDLKLQTDKPRFIPYFMPLCSRNG